MKKLAVLGSAVVSLLAPVKALAADTVITITPPNKGYNDLGKFITNLITLVMGVAVLVVLVMLILGAYEWMVSGGDKEAVAKARNRILNALIGLVVLSIAFALATLAAQILGFSDFKTLVIPSPQ